MKPFFVGENARLSKTISESDVFLFAGITGDMNPMHVNAQYARDTRFRTESRMGSSLRD